MHKNFLFFTAALSIAPIVSAAPTSADLVQQVQAAQLLSDVITYSIDEGDARLAAMKSFIDKSGKADDFAKAKPPAPQPKHLNYMQLFRGALLLVRDGKDSDADPSLKGLPDADLYDTLTQSQYYNMHQFLRFNQQRDSFESMMAYLKSTGLLEQFEKANDEPAPPAQTAATQATPPAAQSVADRIVRVMDEMKASARKQAEANGTSGSKFDAQWPKQLADYRNAIESRVDGFQSKAGDLGKSEPAGTPPPPDKSRAQAPAPTNNPQTIIETPAVAPTPSGAAAPPSPAVIQPPVRSPYSNQTFRARDYSLWNRFDYNPRG